MTEISIFGNGGDLEQLAETAIGLRDDRDTVERGMTAYDALARRNAELEQGINKALLAIKARDVEIENLRLQLAERDNRITSIQTIANEREERYLAERDAAVNMATEYRVVHTKIAHLYATIQLPLPPFLPPIEQSDPSRVAKKKNNHVKTDAPELSEETKG